MYHFDLEAAISLYYNILIGIIHQSLRTSTITFPQVSRVPRAHPYSIESIVLSKLATTLYVLALLDTINSMPLGDVAWQSFSLRYNGDEVPEGIIPQWMTSNYDVWFHDPRAIIINMIEKIGRAHV